MSRVKCFDTEIAMQMKWMDFFTGQSARRSHNMAYGDIDPRRHMENDAVSSIDSSALRL
jgi:hypothetical protein